MSVGETLSSEVIELRDLHRDYFVAFARSMEKEDESDTWADFQTRFAALDAEAANLRAAIAWSDERSDPKLRPLVLALFWWFMARGNIREARNAVDRALAIDATDDDVAVDLLLCAAQACESPSAADTLRHRAVKVARALTDQAPLLRALDNLGWALYQNGLIDECAAVFDEAIEIGRGLDAPAWTADVRRGRGWAAFRSGDTALARSQHDEALGLLRDPPRPRLLLSHFGVHVNLCVQLEDPAAAARLSDEAVAVARRTADPVAIGDALESRAAMLQRAGDLRGAEDCLREALAILPNGVEEFRAQCLDKLADVLVDAGDVATARSVVAEGTTLLLDLVELGAHARWLLTRLLDTQAELAEVEADLDGARRALEAALEQDQRSTISAMGAQRLRTIAAFHARHGDVESAARLLAEAGATVGDDPAHAGERLLDAATVAAYRGELAEATSLASEAASGADSETRLTAYLAIARFSLALGDPAAAGNALAQAEQQVANPWARRSIRAAAAAYAAAAGDGAQARVLLRERRREIARGTLHVEVLEVLAEVAAREDRAGRAVELLALATAQRERLRLPRSAMQVAAERRILDAIGDAIGDEERRLAEARGRALEPMPAIAAELQE